MSEWFVVNYLIGRKFSRLLIYAHDMKQASEVADIQAHHKHHSSARIKILSVRTEEEENEYEKTLRAAIASGKKVL